MNFKSHRTATVHHGHADQDGKIVLDCGTRISGANRLESTNRQVTCERCLALDSGRHRFIEAVGIGGTSLGKHRKTTPVAVARWDEIDLLWGIYGYDRSTGTYPDRCGTIRYDSWDGVYYAHLDEPDEDGSRMVYPKGFQSELYWPWTDERAPRGAGGFGGFMQAVSAMLGRPPYGHTYYRIDRRVSPLGRAS